MQKDAEQTHDFHFTKDDNVLCPNCGSIHTEFHNKFNRNQELKTQESKKQELKIGKVVEGGIGNLKSNSSGSSVSFEVNNAWICNNCSNIFTLETPIIFKGYRITMSDVFQFEYRKWTFKADFVDLFVEMRRNIEKISSDIKKKFGKIVDAPCQISRYIRIGKNIYALTIHAFYDDGHPYLRLEGFERR